MDETQTRAIVNEPEELKPVETAAAAEPAAIDEASAAVQSEPELIPEVALETEIVTEPESEPEPVPEKKSRFGRAKRAE